eukprot:gene7857-5650_t
MEFRQMNWLSLANTKGNQCSRGASRKQEQNTKRTITGELLSGEDKVKTKAQCNPRLTVNRRLP